MLSSPNAAVFLTIFGKFIATEMPNQLQWLNFWQAIEEFRLRARGLKTNEEATKLFDTYLGKKSQVRGHASIS